MKRQNYGPRLGKFVHQLPGDIALAYDLGLMRTIPRQKDLSEEHKFLCEKYEGTSIFLPVSPKKFFRPSKRLRKLRTRKTAKNSKLCYN